MKRRRFAVRHAMLDHDILDIFQQVHRNGRGIHVPRDVHAE
jgi:hypothetical protein